MFLFLPPVFKVYENDALKVTIIRVTEIRSNYLNSDEVGARTSNRDLQGIKVVCGPWEKQEQDRSFHLDNLAT